MLADTVITGCDIIVETAFDDAGDSATVTLGPTGGDADGYFADIMTLAEVVDTQITVGEVAGALLWDDTNDHHLNFRITTAAAGVPGMTIGTEALTQGVAKFIFRCRRY